MTSKTQEKTTVSAVAHEGEMIIAGRDKALPGGRRLRKSALIHMPAQRCQQVSVGGVPDFRRMVGTGGDEASAVRGERGPPNWSVVFEHQQQLRKGFGYRQPSFVRPRQPPALDRHVQRPAMIVCQQLLRLSSQHAGFGNYLLPLRKTRDTGGPPPPSRESPRRPPETTPPPPPPPSPRPPTPP